MSEFEGEKEWHEGGDDHGYRYQYIGPIHYLCECGACFLNRDRWIAHKALAPILVLADEWEADGKRVGYDSREQHENDLLASTVVPALRRASNLPPGEQGGE